MLENILNQKAVSIETALENFNKFNGNAEVMASVMWAEWCGILGINN